MAQIEEVRVQVFRTVSHTVADSHGHGHPGPERSVESAMLIIRDSDGAEGHCAADGDTLRNAVLDGFIRKALIGHDSAMRERIWNRLHEMQRGSGGRLTDRAIGCVDQALWDLYGQKLGAPVWQILGGARRSVPAYASTMCGDDIPGGLSTPEEYADFATSLIAAGYQAIKLHTWMPPISFAPDPDMDAKACAAVRAAVGPDVPLMLDAHHWYSRIDALKLGRALQELDFYWYEEPMEEASISSYRWLSQQLEIPVIGPETAPGQVHTRAEWVAHQACDILRVGAGDTGGITPAMKIIHLAEAFNIQAEVHGGGSANLALLGASANGRWYERGLLHPHVDHDALPPHLNTLIDPIDEHGLIHLTDRSGLGDDYNWDYINHATVASW